MGLEYNPGNVDPRFDDLPEQPGDVAQQPGEDDLLLPAALPRQGQHGQAMVEPDHEGHANNAVEDVQEVVIAAQNEPDGHEQHGLDDLAAVTAPPACNGGF